MNTNIHVDAETAKALSEHAASFGLSIEEFLKKHFGEANGLAPIADVDQWLDELSEGFPDVPPLRADFSTSDNYADD